MVTRNLTRSYEMFSKGVREDTFRFVIPALAVGGIGLMTAQWVNDNVLSRVIGTVDPATPSEVGIAMLVKVVAAVVAVVAGAALGGVGLLLGGGFAVYSLGLAGADFIGLAQSMLGDVTGGGSSGGSMVSRQGISRAPRRTARQITRRSGSPTRVPAASGSTGGSQPSYNY